MGTTQYRRYALTGGIGSGKSTVAQMFRDLGAIIIDADAISRDLMKPGHRVLDHTVDAFGESILNPDGTLNRARLAERVFRDKTELEKLNAIVHPAVRAQAAELVEHAIRTPDFSGIIIDDIPLLVETGRASEFDGVIAVQTDEPTRLKRLREYRNMSRADAQARINAQATDQQRTAIAQWVITNNSSRQKTQAQVQRVWGELLADLESIH